MKAEENGLDQECDWISINALVLIGCINCAGSDCEKSEVLYRVVQPEMLARIFVINEDIRMTIFYMTNLATILRYMKNKICREGSKNPKKFDVEFFKKKMISYEVVFEAVLEEFTHNMFGAHANTVTREQFQE